MNKTFRFSVKSLTFRKWSRKSYSLFKMLNNVVRIGFLTVIYHSATAGHTQEVAPSGQDTIRPGIEFELDEIEVNASRVPLIFPEVARILTIISPEELRYRPASNLSDVLNQTRGIDIRQRGPEGIQADISIRGGTFDQTAILLNGINITDPQTGHHNLNIPVSFSQIEKIEILEGPAARVYGPNAFSGAINIITRNVEKNSLTASYQYGSHNLSDADLSGTFKTQKLYHTISLNHKKSDGYINNTDFALQNLYYRGNADFADGRLDYQFGYANKEFGANAFYTPRYPNQFEQTKTVFSSLKWKSKSPVNLTPAIYWRRHHDRFELFRENPPEWYTTHNYHLTDVFGVNVNSWFTSRLGKTAVGAEIRSENIWSNVLGDKLTTPLKVPNEEALFTHHKSRSSFSVFAEHTVQISRIFASAGFLAQKNSFQNQSWSVYPGIDLNYILYKEVKVFASAGKSLRLPTFTDLYYSGPTNKGNPELAPEEVLSIESGVKYFGRAFSGSANIYWQKGRNLIDWIRLPDEEIWTTSNHTSINTFGFQTYFNLDIQKLLPCNIFISKLTAGYNTTRLTKQKSEWLSYYILDNLRQKININLYQNPTPRLTSAWSIVYQDRNGSYSYFSENGMMEKDYTPFWLIDWKAVYSLKWADLQVSVNNLFNKTYIDYGNIPQPGRWMKAGVVIRIE